MLSKYALKYFRFECLFNDLTLFCFLHHRLTTVFFIFRGEKHPAESNYKEIDKMLALDRFLVYQYDECKQTGLIWAAKRNNTEMVKFLCERLSRVNF